MARDQRENTCCFTGHCSLSPKLLFPLRSTVKSAVRGLVSQGIIHYGVGGAVGFDTLAAETLFELRKEYPQIRVILVYPFEGFYLRWPTAEQKRYQMLLPLYDKIVGIRACP